MKNFSMRFIITAFFLCAINLLYSQGGASRLHDGSGAYAGGIYRNLFKENGHTDREISQKINLAFEQLFHGDTSETVCFNGGKNENGSLAYVSDVNHHDVRSEGMSYGMMICVQMDRKSDFDALWNWAVTYMYVDTPGHPSNGYFKWSMKTDGTPNSETAAPDGEEYFVMALYFAGHRWGNGEGIYNYKMWADKILSSMRHHEVVTGPTRFGPRTVGPMVNESHRMICFVPDKGGNEFSDPSYHLPAFYELWARWGPADDRMFWAEAADSSRRFLRKAAHPVTGLVSDYANFDGTPHVTRWNRNSGNFSYDSWRTASNWSVDWSWWQKDPGERELSNRIQTFFASEDIGHYGAQYSRDGKKLDPSHAPGLVSTNAVAGLAATHPLASRFVEELWNTPVPSSFGQRYYDGLLYMMSLLHCSGEFKIWKPVI